MHGSWCIIRKYKYMNKIKTMIKRILFLLLIYVSFQNTFFANPIDSLTNLINNETNDLIKIRLLIKKGELETDFNKNEALKLFKQAEQLAKENKYLKLQVKVNNTLGLFYLKINELDSAKLIFEKSINICKINNFKEEKIICNFQISNIYWYKNDYPSSLKWAYKALGEFKMYENDTIKANLLNILGNNYYRLKDYTKALNFFNQSLKLKKQIGDSISMSRTFNNLGNIYAELKNHDKSLFYYNKNLEISIKNKIPYKIAISYANIAGIYREKGEYNKALEYAFKALKIDTTLHDLYGEAADYNEIAFSYKGLKQYEKAKQYLYKSLKIVRKIKAYDLEINLLKDFSDTYSEIGNNKKALEYYKQYASLKDSLLNKIKNKQIVEADKKYETQKKNTEIQQLKIDQIEDKNMQIIFLLIIISLAVVSFFLIFFFRQRIKINSVLRDKNSQLKQLNSTQNRLMSIISHDFKAPLSAFYSITNSLKTKFDKIDRNEIDRLLVRMLNSSVALKIQLENMLNWAITQQREISVSKSTYNLHILSYKVIMVLQEFANEKSITIENNINEECEIKTDGKLFSIILNNLITNAVKFSKFNSTVYISAKRNNEKVILSVKDDGIGMNEETKNGLFLGNKNSESNENTGTRLGLIVSKDIITKLDGKIWVESKLSEGTEFFIEFG